MRKIEVQSLQEAMTEQPMDWDEMGGADYVRYTVSIAEFRNHLADMITRVEEVEIDGCYYLENRIDRDRLHKDIFYLQQISARLTLEADEMSKMRME